MPVLPLALTQRKKAFYSGAVTAQVGNTLNETDLVSFTIPAGILGSLGAIRLHGMFEFYNNTGGGVAMWIRLYWGGTLIATFVPYNAATNGAGQYWFDVVLQGFNSVTAQLERSAMWFSHPGGIATGFNATAYAMGIHHALAAISKDSAVSQILKATVQYNVASPFIVTGSGVAFVEEVA